MCKWLDVGHVGVHTAFKNLSLAKICHREDNAKRLSGRTTVVAVSVLPRSQHSSNTMRMRRAAVLHNKTSSWSEIPPLFRCWSARQLR